MGILSSRSLIAPIIDKRNLIAIILVGIFFAIYRLSGGTVTSVPKGTKVPMVKPAGQMMIFEDFNSSPQDALKELKAPDDSQKKSDLLESILKGPKKGTTAQEVEPQRQPSQKLDDIERSLGLR
jgi:hypothetical protein